MKEFDKWFEKDVQPLEGNYDYLSAYSNNQTGWRAALRWVCKVGNLKVAGKGFELGLYDILRSELNGVGEIENDRIRKSKEEVLV